MVAAAPPIPATKDLRATWWKINDQGSTGSCVGWATADSVVRWHLAKAGRITNADLLSPRFIWMAAKETDAFTTRPTTFVETEGTSLKAALDVVRKYGAIRDKLMPFAAGTLFPGDAKTFYALAAQLKILAYFNLGTNLSNWRTWLATKGPILTRLDVDRTWDQAPVNKGMLESTSRRRPVVGTRSRSSATGPGASSSGTAGAQGGATRASATPRSPTPRRRSPRRTGSRSECDGRVGSDPGPASAQAERRARRRSSVRRGTSAASFTISST